MRYPFFSTCVNWPKNLHAAKDFLDENGEDISRDAFLALVRPSQMRRIENELGYGGPGGLIMEKDWHVRYKREPTSGIPFFVHSATEFVFAEEKDIQDLNDRILDGPFAENTILIYRPGLMSGLPPPEESQGADLFEHTLLTIMEDSDRVAIVEGPEAQLMNLNDRRILDQTIALLRGSGRLALHEAHEENTPDLLDALKRFPDARVLSADQSLTETASPSQP